MRRIIPLLLFIFSALTSLGQSVDGGLKTLTATVVTTNNYAVTESLPAAYDPKERFIVKFPAINTGAVTLKRNTLDPVAVKNEDGTALSSGDIKVNGYKLLSYNGTYYQIIGGSAGGGSGVTSVSGTTNRITSTGGATPVIDISASYVGQTSIVTVGTIGTGTWNATSIALGKGGTGSSLSDPGANKLWGWDDTDNTIGFWTLGSGLTYTHSTHTLSASSSFALTDGNATTANGTAVDLGGIGTSQIDIAMTAADFNIDGDASSNFSVGSSSTFSNINLTASGTVSVTGSSILLSTLPDGGGLSWNPSTNSYDLGGTVNTATNITTGTNAVFFRTAAGNTAAAHFSVNPVGANRIVEMQGNGSVANSGATVRVTSNSTTDDNVVDIFATTAAGLIKWIRMQSLGGAGIAVKEQIDGIGMVYDASYYTNGNALGDRWLPDWGAVRSGVATITNKTISGASNTITNISLTSGITGVLPVANGGTNVASYAVGDLLYASASTTLSKLADVATGNTLISGGVTTAPSWGKVGLTTHVSGTLGAANGGTGVANNAASTITISGSFATTLTVTNTTGVTLPTTGTLSTLAGSESLTNKKLGSLTTNGFVKVGSGDGTLSSGPDLTTTFSAANTITGTATNTLKLAFASLGTTVTDGAGTYYQNPTAAASGLQQISPILTLEGQGWKTTATAASQAVAFAMYTLPVQGSTNPTGTFNFASNVNGGGYVNRLQIDIANQVTTLLGSTSAGLFFGDNTLQLTRSLSGTQGLVLLGPSASAIYSFAITGASSNNYNGTTGTAGSMQFVGNFVPSSGSQVFNYAAFTGTINMTSTSSGAVTLIKNTQTVTSAKGDYYFALDNPSVTTVAGTRYGFATTAINNGLGTITPTAALHVVGTTKLDGVVTLPTVGNKISIKEGSGGFMGQTALVLGTKAVTVSGVTTSTRCFVSRAVGSGGSLTVKYDCACTANTVTITAEVAADTINTSDVSTINYILFEPAP